MHYLENDPAFAGVEIVSSSARRLRRGGLDLRLVIDREGGVDVATCERIARRLNHALDRYPQQYTLSVESAGLERPLLRPADYTRFTGKSVKILTNLGIQGAKTHRGRLLGLRGSNVVLERPGGELPIPLELIKHANLEYDPRNDLTKDKQERRRKA
ncbi:MAG: ribosome maturation factor RimP [Candidatus Eremiobacteraeota bacterium]|nr:ribosome maturation factor RimP [Candidatus Eremiobacteraeota bacterium]MBV8356255.1 ribosome maturation factor RimP [Candidatus Eremiobacteraeota bacterium]